MAAVPCTLRNDNDHSGAKRERLGRPVVAHDFRHRGAVEDVNQLVAGEMAFPMVCPRGLDRQQEAVTVGRQLRDATLCLRPRRLGVRRNMCNFVSSALRSMMLGVLLSMSLSIIASLFPSSEQRRET